MKFEIDQKVIPRTMGGRVLDDSVVRTEAWWVHPDTRMRLELLYKHDESVTPDSIEEKKTYFYQQAEQVCLRFNNLYTNTRLEF